MTTTVQTTHVLMFANGEPLIRAISNGLLFASAERVLPKIHALKFEFDGQLRVITTDRYRLCIEQVETDPQMDQATQPHFAFLLPRDDAKAALAVLKGAKRDRITLLFDEQNGTLKISTYSTSSEYKTDRDSEFPAYQALVPDDDDAVEVSRIGFNPKMLVDLGKVQTSQRLDVITLLTFGEHKPVKVSFRDGPTAVVIPVRLP